MRHRARRLRAVRSSMLATVAIAALVLAGCDSPTPTEPTVVSDPVSKYSAEVPVEWHKMQLMMVEMTPGFTPPVASRTFGYTGIALYEALVPGMADHQSLVGQLNEMPAMPKPETNVKYYWPAVANSTLAQISRHMFGDQALPATAAHCIDSLEDIYESEYYATEDGDMITRSIAYGQKVADAVFEWSKTDGGHEGYNKNFPSSYVPPVGPGLWVPTPRRGGAPQPALQPYWGQNRPFVLAKGNPNAGIDPGAPPAYSEDPNSELYKEALEVHDAVANLTPEQEQIALFWSDDPGKTCTPPGHSVSILCQCIESKSNTLDFAAEAFAKMGIVVNDAFIACWEAKYRYNLLRPITYIQKIIDPNWNTPDVTDPVNTPPFPEYTSGHSVQSGAAAQVLEKLYGEHFAFTDHTHDHRMDITLQPRSFASFADFANEAAISRLYGGIHYRAAIERGVAQGRKVGMAVNNLKFMK